MTSPVVARATTAVLLSVAAMGAIAQSANATSFGQFGGVMAAVLLVVVAIGVVRAWRWAPGVAFLLGLFWLWAVVGLTVQRQLSLPQVIVWLAWSIVVMAAAVAARG
jgi:hypothetical protein